MAAIRRAAGPEAWALVEPCLVTAQRLGVGIHLVGGPVRDLLLGRPMRDIDLIVEPPVGARKPGAQDVAREALARRSRDGAHDMLPRGARLVHHDRFGTVRVQSGESVVDLATVRAEAYEAPGALPTVRAGTLEEDLQRRDFTVNALAVPLNAAARHGRPALVDIGEGITDLESATLRVFHARSFHDDPTRALRAARLGPRLGFRLSRGSRAALRSALRDGAFGGVSGPRFRAEIAKLFSDTRLGLDPAGALRLLADWHVLAALEPGLCLPREAVAPLRRLGHLLAVPPWSEIGRPWLAGLMVWTAALDAPLRRRTLRRLAVEGEVARRIRAFPKGRERSLRALARRRGRGAAHATLQGTAEEELVALAAWSPQNLRRRVLRYAADDRSVVLPVGGDDLLELGLSGPDVGRALRRLRVAVLDREVRTRAEALALAREVARGRDTAGRRRRGPGSV